MHLLSQHCCWEEERRARERKRKARNRGAFGEPAGDEVGEVAQAA